MFYVAVVLFPRPGGSASLTTGLLYCTLPGAALEDQTEATAGSKCSSVSNNGHSSLCPCITTATLAVIWLLGTIQGAD